MKALGALVGLLATLGLLVGHAIPAVASADLEATGWWWRAQTGLAAPLPPPPGVPEEGLAVSGAPDGPAAVAALRFGVGPGEVLAATLSLDVASDQGGAAAGIDACPASRPWRTARAGAWEDRPPADCGRGRAAGSASDDGRSWFFDVTDLVAAGVLDVVLTPRPGPPFQVAFAPPDSSALQVTTVSEPEQFQAPPPPPPPPPGFAPPEPDGGSTPPAAGFAPGPQAGFGDWAEPGVPLPEAAEGAPREQPASPAPAEEPPARPLPVEPTADDSSAVGALLVLALLGSVVLLQRQPAPSAVGLGRFRQALPPPAAPGGLGRFARTRQGAAPPLR